MSKRCSKCKQVKDEGEFSKDKATKDGLHFWCKGCCAKRWSEYYQTHKEEILARTNEYCHMHPEVKERFYKKHPLYLTWIDMRRRCLNPNHKAYPRYGGRGITICKSWLNNYRLFEKFMLDNDWKSGMTIDRIDNDGNYTPRNCRVVTKSQNSSNRWIKIFS